MAERFATEIRLGGRLAEADRAALLAAVDADGASLDWEPAPVGAADLRRVAAAGEPLVLTHAEATGGELAAIEAFCQARGLTYARWCEGSGEFEPERSAWRPGMAAPATRACTGTGTPVLALGDLRAAREAGRTLAELVAALEAELFPVPPFRLAPA